MATKDEIIIELSKRKIFLLFLGSIFFVIFGIWLYLNDSVIRFHRWIINSYIVDAVAFICILFFSVCGFLIIKKIINKKPGIIINSSGLIDNSSSMSVGFISWSEILNHEVIEIGMQKMLVIKLKDPKKYINSKSAINNIISKINYNFCGSSVVINPSFLAISFNELVIIFEKYQNIYNNELTVQNSEVY